MSTARKTATPLDRGLMFALLAVLVWVPLPLGSNREWSAALFALLVGLIALGWTVSLSQKPEVRNNALAPSWVLLALLAATQAWVAAQWLFGWTADPGSTLRYLTLGLAYALLFILTVGLFHTRRRLTVLLAVLVVSGTLQAFYGAFMTLSGVEWLLATPKEYGRGVATGTFVNRNHLAGYLELTLACGIGLLMALRDGRPLRWRNVLELLLGPKARLRLALVIMVIGLVMTQSRMGNTGFFVSLLVVGGLFVLITPENRLRNGLILASIIVIDMLVISQYFGLERLKDRLAQTEVTIERGEAGQLVFNINDLRGIIFTNAMALARDKPLVGHGAGSFEAVFQAHTGPNIGPHIDHAHNDYLQLWIELGALGSLPLLAFALLALWHALKALRRRDSPYRSGVGFGAAMGILAIMIHSGSDFNLQIPANAATFVVVCAIAVLANHHTKTRRG